MEQHSLCLPFLDIMKNKDPEILTFEWTYFIKTPILADVFHLTLATSNNAKIIHLLHLLDESASWWKTAKLEENVWTNFKKTLCSREYPQNLIQKAI